MTSERCPDFSEVPLVTIPACFFVVVAIGYLIYSLSSSDTGAAVALAFVILVISAPLLIWHITVVFRWSAKQLHKRNKFNFYVFSLMQIFLLFIESFLIPIVFKLLGLSNLAFFANMASFIDDFRTFSFVAIGVFVVALVPVLIFAGIWFWSAKKYLTNHSGGTPSGAP